MEGELSCEGQKVSVCPSGTCDLKEEHLTNKITTPKSLPLGLLCREPKPERRPSFGVRDHQNIAQNCSSSLGPRGADVGPAHNKEAAS